MAEIIQHPVQQAELDKIIVSKLIKQFIFLGLVTLSLGLILAWFISISISYPLQELGKTASKIGKGDFNAKSNLFSTDEIGKLSKTLNKMAMHLKTSTFSLNDMEKKVKERTKALTKANNELKKLDKAKSEFIAIASHELRTPLASIISLLDLLSENWDKLKTKKDTINLIEISFHESKRLLQIVNDILDLSKMESGKMQFNFRNANLTEILDFTYSEANILADIKDIRIEKDYAPDLPTLKIDSSKFTQAISNLLNNAVKILKSGDKITISAKERMNKIVISIEDNGPGIPPNKLPQLFRPFVQVTSANEHHEGTGLGLAITKRIIEAHHGTIGVKSKLKKGTKFTIILPKK